MKNEEFTDHLSFTIYHLPLTIYHLPFIKGISLTP